MYPCTYVGMHGALLVHDKRGRTEPPSANCVPETTTAPVLMLCTRILVLEDVNCPYEDGAARRIRQMVVNLQDLHFTLF